jgi:hypothetical protein
MRSLRAECPWPSDLLPLNEAARSPLGDVRRLRLGARAGGLVSYAGREYQTFRRRVPLYVLCDLGGRS